MRHKSDHIRSSFFEKLHDVVQIEVFATKNKDLEKISQTQVYFR
jgi:hypothetical protein